ncbi:MAG: hypothetical protein LBS11_01435 [Oscillospiraceae bacterium]|nr:hypothetical protein [Oscillospiraceae bacterium]
MTTETGLFTLVDQLKELRNVKDKLKDQLKDVNTQIDDTEKQLSDMMAETETPNFTHAGTMLCLKTKTRVSAVTGFKDELYAALKANGYASLVYETVNTNSLSSFVKEQIDENDDALPDWLTGLVGVYDMTSISLHKAMNK